MKWSKKKPSSSLITHVFPASWLSKFKQNKNGTTEHQEAANIKEKGKAKLPSLKSSSPITKVGLKQSRLYADDDPYWRLSFTQDSFDAHQQIQNPLWSGSYDDCDHVSTWNSKIALEEENHKFNHMVSRKISHKEAKFGSKKRNFITDEKLRKLSRKALEERIAENAREPDQEAEVIEKDIFEIEPGNEKALQRSKEESTAYNSRKMSNCMLKSLNIEDKSDKYTEEEFESDCLEMNEKTLKSDYQHRKSVYINQKRRRKHGIKVGANSPRTPARMECRIKALEDMKKAKTKMRQKAKEERSGGDRTAFDSYAVVKSSFDPFKDFKDSMVEMITERGIKSSEELEELLACYLTLNSDEYHDLIIKVFRQVWFELNQVIGAQLQQCCCS